MLSFLQFNYKFSVYTDQMTFAEQLYLYEMYKYNPLKFSITNAVIDINKVRAITLPNEIIINELVD